MAVSREGARVDARVTRSRAAMRGAFLALLARAKLETITGVMIAEEAQVGYATFFRHYADVRAVLTDIVATLTDDLAQAMMPALLAGDSAGAAGTLVAAIDARREMFRALLAGGGDALRAELAAQVIARVAQPGIAPAWFPQRLATRLTVVGTIELLDWWLREEPDREPAEISALLDRLVIARLADKT
jgi:AcrR family transcriptional regulator